MSIRPPSSSGTSDALGNVVEGFSLNAVENSVEGVTIAGGGLNVGGTDYPNIARETGGDGNLATIGGGYDNITDGAVASTISGGAHHRITTPATHATIGGGSYGEITGGDYGTIAGGTLSEVSASSGTVGGGSTNTVSAVAGTVSGGDTNNVSGVGGSIGGGYNNTEAGSRGTVGGGDQNAITAAGSYATIGGGDRNAAQAAHATIGGGQQNLATGAHSSIGGGKSNQTSGTASVVAGGELNTNNTGGNYAFIGGGLSNNVSATGLYSAVAGGNANIISNEYSAIPGGRQNQVTEKYAMASGWYAKASQFGQVAQAAGRFAALGDAQTSVSVAYNVTTDATETTLFLDGAAGTKNLTIPSDTTWAFSILVVARRTDVDGESAAYKFEGCIDNNGGTSGEVGTTTKTVLAEDTAGWDANVFFNGNFLRVKGTGEAAKTIRWVARITLVEVTG